MNNYKITYTLHGSNEVYNQYFNNLEEAEKMHQIIKNGQFTVNVKDCMLSEKEKDSWYLLAM